MKEILKKSIEWFEKAAEMGSVDAMVQVANLYRFSEEESKAIYWLTKGAKLNYFPAMIGLIEIEEIIKNYLKVRFVTYKN